MHRHFWPSKFPFGDTWAPKRALTITLTLTLTLRWRGRTLLLRQTTVLGKTTLCYSDIITSILYYYLYQEPRREHPFRGFGGDTHTWLNSMTLLITAWTLFASVVWSNNRCCAVHPPCMSGGKFVLGSAASTTHSWQQSALISNSSKHYLGIDV